MIIHKSGQQMRLAAFRALDAAQIADKIVRIAADLPPFLIRQICHSVSLLSQKIADRFGRRAAKSNLRKGDIGRRAANHPRLLPLKNGID